jgi:hypothetical protein
MPNKSIVILSTLAVSSIALLLGTIATNYDLTLPSQALASDNSSIDRINAQLGRPTRIALGSKAVFDSEDLEVLVLSVRDSRCPKDLNCMWGGEAYVKLQAWQADKNLGECELTLGVGNPDYYYPNNIKQMGAYYLRVLEIEPYPTINREEVDRSTTQTVTLQVQKSPFKLKDASLYPQLQPRPLEAAILGHPFTLLNNQSYYLADARDSDGNSYVRAQIYFEYARPIAGKSDLVEISLAIQPVGSTDRLNVIRQTVKLGTQLQIENREGGFNLQLLKVESFIEDTRSNLNTPSPLGYRVSLKAERESN